MRKFPLDKEAYNEIHNQFTNLLKNLPQHYKNHSPFNFKFMEWDHFPLI